MPYNEVVTMPYNEVVTLEEVANRIDRVMSHAAYSEGGKQMTRARLSEAQVMDLVAGRQRERSKLRHWEFEELRRLLDARGFGFHEAVERGGYLIIRLTSLEAAPVINILGANRAV